MPDGQGQPMIPMYLGHLPLVFTYKTGTGEYIKVFFWVTVGIHAGHSFLHHTDNQWGLRNNDLTAAMYQPDPQ